MMVIRRLIVRKPLWIVAMVVVGFLLFAGNQQKPKPADPWSAAPAGSADQSGTSASTDGKDDHSMIASAVGGVAQSVGKVAGVDIDLGKIKSNTVDSYKNTAATMGQANQQSSQ